MAVESRLPAAARPFVGVFVAAVLLAGFAGRAPAGQPWYVATDGHDLNPGTAASPFATIQHAITVALPGDEVLIADGVYRGGGNREIDFLGKAVTVRSAGGVSANCAIFAEGHDGFVFGTGETNTSLLADISIVGAAAGIVVNGAFPRLSGCVVDSCVTGVDVAGSGGRVLMTGCLVRFGGTGIRFRNDANGGRVESTTISDNTGPGVLTSGAWTVYGFGSLVLADCHILRNQGSGLEHEATSGGVNVEACEVADNGNWGLFSAASQDYGLNVAGGSVHGNGAGGINTISSRWDQIAGCEVHGNAGPGILTSWDAAYGIIDCVIHDNAGHGISFGNGPLKNTKRWRPVTVSGCDIFDNDGCGIDFAYGPHHDNLVTACVIRGNAMAGIRVTTALEAGAQTRILIEQSTIVGNADGIQIASAVPVLVDRALIAFNQGAAVNCLVTPDVTLACSDLYGNTGGDWTGDIAGQLGGSGNLTADPRLCDVAAADLQLLDVSPCAAANQPDCGRIGALDVGCYATPRFIELVDVPADQGGALRLSWNASCFDRPQAAQPVTGYGVYRRQVGSPPQNPADRSDRLPQLAGAELLGWDFLMTVPSRGDAGYQVVVPTLCDAPADGGDSTRFWSVFMVSAMTGDPFVFYDSASDSGRSLDNLAPAAPSGLRLEPDRRLAWESSDAGDFAHYTVYGSAVNHRDGSESCLGLTTSLGLDVAALAYPHFLVTVSDIHGNEGEAARLDAPSAVDSSPAAALRLHPCQPNPFNPSTTLRFELPDAGPVRIAVYDLAGRCVRTLMDGSLARGPHAVVWDGRDAAGRAAGAGNYLARLEFGGGFRTVQMGLVK